MRKQAGHIINAYLSGMFDGCLVATGNLIEDLRGTDHYGNFRDFSGDVRTSAIEVLEYCQKADTTIITTRNSIYYSNGNLIESQLGLDHDYIDTENYIRAVWDENQVVPTRYILTACGAKATGLPIFTEVFRKGFLFTHSGSLEKFPLTKDAYLEVLDV